MKKILSLLIFCLIGICGWANETVYKTLDFSTTTMSNYVNNYTSEFEATTNSFTWTVSHFNNGSASSPWTIVRAGRKSDTSIASITTNSSIEKAVTKVVVTVTQVNASKVNSAKLLVSSNAEFTSNNLQTIELSSLSVGENTYVITTPTENQYYNLVWDLAKDGSNNGFLRISKIEYYINDGETPPLPTYSVTLPNSLTGGTVTANVSNLTQIAEGTTVTITATPETGYELDWMKVNDEEVTNPYSFTIDENKIVTASFKEKSITEVSTIAELNDLPDDTQFIMNGSTICIWSYNGYTYIQDDTEATLIYGTLPNVTYAITDVIPGGWQGTKITWYGFPEVKYATGFTEATIQQNIPATELDLASISTGDWGKYVVAKGVIISTSTGGDEPPVDENTVIFDFDNNYSELFPTFGLSTQSTHDGDFTEPTTTTLNNISIIITDNPNLNEQGTNQNRLWSNTPRLRMYGGTMTVTAAAEYNITGISFTNHSSNFNMSTETGELGGVSTNRTWTGNANSIVFTINSNTQINSMTITFASTSKAQEVTKQYTLIDANGNTLTAYPSKLGYMEVPDDLTKTYDVYGVLDFHNNKPEILPLGFIDDEGVVTDNIDIIESSVKKVIYYNTQGIQSSKPFDGLNIVVTEYENGTKRINKEMRK